MMELSDVMRELERSRRLYVDPSSSMVDRARARLEIRRYYDVLREKGYWWLASHYEEFFREVVR